jgi:hypothetical protein
MDQLEDHSSPSVPVETEQHQDVAVGVSDQLTTGQKYWHEHVIVRRTPDEIRRGEPAAYVRRLS